MIRQVLTSRETAELLGVTPGRVRQLARAGKLKPYQRTPYGRLYALMDIEEYLTKHKATT